MELVTGWDVNVEDRDQRLKNLNRTYNDQMDVGTTQFALYYKEWLKARAKAPPVPSVSLPSRPSCIEPLGKRWVSVSRGSTNTSLYQAVFGPSLQRGDTRDGVLIDDANLVVESGVGATEGSCKFGNSVHSDVGVRQRQSNSVQECWMPEVTAMPRRSYSFRIFSCSSDPNRGAICHTQISKNASAAIAREPNSNVPSTSLGRAISLISYSDSLGECEAAIRLVAKAWLDSHGDSHVKIALSTTSVIEGLLEVVFASKDDETLELAISILAELVAQNEMNGQVVLNADPQLEIFLRLLRSKTLFLKAAILLYLLKPKAKQMLSLDWIPLALHVLDYGDQMQTLFTVQCSPKSAALYFLDQLLMGFNVDRNVENAKQMVALGGLDLLIRRLEMGDAHEKTTCASLLVTCIRADGSCRHYLAANVKKESIIQMLLGNQLRSNGIALSFLCELVCLNRITQIIKFLNGLKNDGCLNTMHVLLVYLQQAPLEQRPMTAAILLQLDLLGDPLQYSIYREEGIDAIVAALEHTLHNKKLQEQCSRALWFLGSRFSCTGEAMAEAWLLKRAGLDGERADLFNSKEIIADEIARLEEEEKATEDWLRSLAIILLGSGNKRLLVALSNCIADGIPSLARSCLVTVAWMSNSLSSLRNAITLSSLACSIFAPRLLVSLNYDRALEERVLASLSLLNFARHPECLPKLFPFDKETVRSLQDLAQVTWTAKELLSACCR